MNSFSIIVLSYNHPDLTARCIQSIYNLDYKGEIYLAHNGSLEKHIGQLQTAFPHVTHLISKNNTGYSGGANFALSEVFKKYYTVLFLTNDTELLQLPKIIPNHFSSVKSLKRQTEKIDSLGGLIDLKNGKLLHRKDDIDIFNQNQYMPYIPGTAFWLSKNVFEILEGFDESFHTYWEDVDFSYRAHLNKIIILHSNETLIRHKIGKTCHKNDFYTYYLYQRNRKKFMQKHHLTTLRFWFLFYKDLFKNCKFRFKTTWKILND